MGGTGGPGADRAAAQTGLTGAGLLASTQAPSSTMANLGIEDVAQPSSGALSGADGAIAVPKGPTSATDTPALEPGTPAVIAPPSNVYTAPSTTELVAPPSTPQASGFTLAGIPNLGFPTGVTDETPLGQYTHVPYGKDVVPPGITGDSITGDAIVATADNKVFKGGRQIWPPTDGSTEANAWLKAHPDYNAEVGADKSKPYQHADMTWWLADEGSDPTLDPKYVPPSYWPYATWGVW